MENPVYIPFTEIKLIKTDLFDIETELSVKLPTIEGLLGDKLTAFVPNTIGVPFETKNGNSMVMQIANQLYDIGELFDFQMILIKSQMLSRQHIPKRQDTRAMTFQKSRFYRILSILAITCFK